MYIECFLFFSRLVDYMCVYVRANNASGNVQFSIKICRKWYFIVHNLNHILTAHLVSWIILLLGNPEV